MDKSFLSDANVIKASRHFVCIRLATYEDVEEAKFLKSFGAGQSGELENTVFVLLTPDAKESLCKASRSPGFESRTPNLQASTMDNISLAFHPEDQTESDVPRLPQMKDFRLGLNVSSCDGLPSVICVGENENQISAMQSKLAPLAFSKELAGKFVYASTTDFDELEIVKGYQGKTGFAVIQPGQYGVDGELIKMLPFEIDSGDLKSAMINLVDGTKKVVKSHRDHVRKGNSTGQRWETEIPVTDPNSVRAMERNQSQQGRGSRPSSRSGAGRSDSQGRPPGGGPPRRGGGE